MCLHVSGTGPGIHHMFWKKFGVIKHIRIRIIRKQDTQIDVLMQGRS